MRYLSVIFLTTLLLQSALNAMEMDSIVKVDKREETLTKEIKMDVTLSTPETGSLYYDSSGLYFKLNHKGNFVCRDFNIKDHNLESCRARANLHITNVNQNDATVQYTLTYTHQNGKDETITNAITIPIGHERSIYLGLKAHYLAALTIQASRRKDDLPYEDIQFIEDVCVESLISGNHGTTITGSTVKKLLN
jgi:hypothetical protein